MSTIKILDTHTINKIAAGEVVERPCSVVKELVENSIDAKASSITVEIKNGGIDFMRVTDNGVGISKEEADLAFLRHATSKINIAEDLSHVLTLGFRGEALASIAAVAHVEMITKTTGDITGKRVAVEGGKFVSSDEIACPSGTTLIIRHIFYNVPARKEFLGSPSTEAAKISDYMTKLALAHPEISFKYIQNNKTQFSTSGSHELLNSVLQIYGKETAKNTFKFYYRSQDIECVGLLGNPSLNRGNRNYEHFFINGRYIKSTLLQRAVEAAYKTRVMVGKFPFIILHLNLPPEQVDVNVHPTKMQVRFKNEELIYQTVYDGVFSALNEEYLVPQVVPQEVPRSPQPVISSPKDSATGSLSEADTFFTPRKIDNSPTAKTMLAAPLVDGSLQKPKAFVYQEEKLFGEMQKSLVTDTQTEESGEKENLQTNKWQEEVLPDTPLFIGEQGSDLNIPLYTLIGQLFQTYWLIQYDEKVFIMDQHAAHERVMYEKFMASFKKGTIATQLLLVPETFAITSSEKLLITKEELLFKNLGFKCELFGENSIVIREVPFIFNAPLPAYIFKDILDTLDTHKPHDIASVKEETIIRLACRSAIKAHDKISKAECMYLIESLLSLENPFSCPHGRPTLISLSKSDIEKMFKRI